MTNYSEVSTTQHEAGQEQRLASFKVTKLIYLLFGILKFFRLRFVFKLFG